MNHKIYLKLAALELDEANFIQELIEDFPEETQNDYLEIYFFKRRDPLLILICTLFGLIGFAGVQRFITGRIGLGLLYFFTGGFLLIGTIIDLVKYKKLAQNYNLRIAAQTLSLLKNSF